MWRAEVDRQAGLQHYRTRKGVTPRDIRLDHLQFGRGDHRCAHRAGGRDDRNTLVSRCHDAHVTHNDAAGGGISAAILTTDAAATPCPHCTTGQVVCTRRLLATPRARPP